MIRIVSKPIHVRAGCSCRTRCVCMRTCKLQLRAQLHVRTRFAATDQPAFLEPHHAASDVHSCHTCRSAVKLQLPGSCQQVGNSTCSQAAGSRDGCSCVPRGRGGQEHTANVQQVGIARLWRRRRCGGSRSITDCCCSIAALRGGLTKHETRHEAGDTKDTNSGSVLAHRPHCSTIVAVAHDDTVAGHGRECLGRLPSHQAESSCGEPRRVCQGLVGQIDEADALLLVLKQQADGVLLGVGGCAPQQCYAHAQPRLIVAAVADIGEAGICAQN